ncbi:MAG: hypothetical protein EA425_00870 [Puniceicoccaceae bacterium]|nr:MAG: hypothetical protein EA425_00870 [Puniceicoccaceae bacterium]
MPSSLFHYTTGAVLLLTAAACCLMAETEIVPRQDISELMTEEEFQAAGLQKLSPEELAALNTWLYGYVEVERKVAAEKAVEEAVPSGERAFGLEQLPGRVAEIFRSTPEVIESRILGRFTGWEGNTVFRLENGQVWRQAEPGVFYLPRTDPVIRIEKGMLGAYFLRVDGQGTRVRVRRIE